MTVAQMILRLQALGPEWQDRPVFCPDGWGDVDECTSMKKDGDGTIVLGFVRRELVTEARQPVIEIGPPCVLPHPSVTWKP